jgi:hypothetical protein
MKRIFSAFLTLSAAMILAVLPAVTAVHAQCTNATLTGNYGMNFSGFTTHSKDLRGAEVPWVVVGVVTFDGAGNVSIGYSGAINGVVFTGQTGSGTYGVNSDCTGSFSFTAGDAAGTDANLAIIGGGTEVFGVVTDAGSSVTFDLKKQ